MSDVAVAVLLAIAVASVALSAAGVALMHDVFDRLHYTAPATAIAPVAVAAAIVVREGLGPAGIRSALAAAAIFVTAPVLSHATGRAARVRQFGHWRATDHERCP